ncbi:VanZ family protein [Adlercreutzia sp. R25]|uniref:VanZ family protein n=1 Tax=Adlercreutzia shanghongiae TaxID=3111773 RepID=UPI002DBC7FCB|nr:VanZ family protein [Adlercreutzia sp. R25]MEC4272010.1 VanZ family protein [Adlercreutzia sp. R25]
MLWAAVIFFMSAHAGSDFDGTGPLAAIKRWLVGLVAPVFGPETDIVNVAAHFTEYLVFGVLLFLAAHQTWPNAKTVQLALIAIALASLYAVTDEFHQSFVPGRLCDPADWLTDTLGAALGASAAATLSSASLSSHLRVFRDC